MKKFIITVSVIVVLFVLFDILYYNYGFYIDFNPKADVTAFVKTDGKNILIEKNGQLEKIEIKGVNVGAGLPGEWSTDYDIDKETYKRWFAYIQEMGANTIRIYTIQGEAFYEAFHEYNTDNADPLYLLQGIGMNDYINNSRFSAMDDEFNGQLLDNAKKAADVIHGRREISWLEHKTGNGSGNFKYDISDWVLGYIIGIDWETTTVAYTNKMYEHLPEYCSYQGEYLYTSEEAKPFEAVMASIGDALIAYESNKYKEQRLIAFSNYAFTDPFVYSDEIKKFFSKVDSFDAEHIRCTDQVISGHFASYHAYPYYPDFLKYLEDWSPLGINKADFSNTYKAYITALSKHHTMPVVITEFGVSTSRGTSHGDMDTNQKVGNFTENEQGAVLVESYQTIMESGCAGGCISSWHDEWHKRTWNTLHAVNLKRTPYWSDAQTGEQGFGLLTFDPGEEKSVCYVDGDVRDWADTNIVLKADGISLSCQYDEKYIYFMLGKNNLDLEHDTIYIPLDITPKSGSNYCENDNLKFDREIDFLIEINGKENSSMIVQERYEALRSTYSSPVYKHNAYYEERIPDINESDFVPINMIVEKAYYEDIFDLDPTRDAKFFETGKLLYGNANPQSPDFNSLADFCAGENCVEIKLPWQLLNFADPSNMKIHDDYYDGNYGVEYITIDEIYAGVCEGNEQRRITLDKIKLEGWKNNPTYHERLKESYYIVQKMWK